MMAIDEDHEAEQSSQSNMSGMSPQDQLTYDPTQGPGTDAWQRSVQASMEVNAQMRRN